MKLFSLTIGAIILISTTTAAPASSKKCGSKYGECDPGYCCSKYNWCGRSNDHCLVSKGCQSEFGLCDNDNDISNNKFSKRDKKPKYDEDFYLLKVKDPSSKNRKRQEISDTVDATISEIHNLIMDNIDTYKNVTVLQEMEETANILRKRNTESSTTTESPLVYPISSYNEKTILYSYLSGELLKKVLSMSNIVGFEKNFIYEKEEEIYNREDILEDTKWNDFKVRKNSPLHLSLISQGKYDDEIIDQYDDNYYYQKKGGKGISMFIFDDGFRFDYKEFSNSNRITKCLIGVDQGNIYEVESEMHCGSTNYTTDNHGTKVATIAGGRFHGVADNINIYGVVLNDFSSASIVSALTYIKDKMFVPHKTIFNFSFGGFDYINIPSDESDEKKYYRKIEQELINEMSNDGAIFVASAGNSNRKVYDTKRNVIHIPSGFDNVIAVGGVSSTDKDVINRRLKRAPNSNSGKLVDIHAPYDVTISYKCHNDTIIKDNRVSGTSFSSPIVAGVAAVIMSDNKKIQFNSESMLKYLLNISQKNVISDDGGSANNFINNGKHIVYSQNNIYYGCGIFSGNKHCGENECCSKDGFCDESGSDYCSIDEGCQIEFGICE
ncbi:carbohydrate-binding module family 18 protein [Piromyces sp. E2]|nr:carbohydrate-binding module family 18 protein [Piromyces sp. E2]|eukprot:OUM59375.1 carbohydrate-binding module family 18 protein [Piromyces sp. E2]